MKPRARVGFALGLLLVVAVFGARASGAPSHGPNHQGGGHDGHDGGGKKHAKVKIKAPELAIAGHRVKIRGSVKRKVDARRVALQVKKRKRHWKTVDRARAHGKKDKFKLRLRAPRMTGVVKVRVVARSRRHSKAKSKRVDLAVTKTDVLKPSNVVSAPAPGTAGTIVYDGKRAPKRGQYVALGVGPQTPYGLLGKVTAVDRSGQATSIAVTPASLFEAVPEGHIKMKPKAAMAANARKGGPARLRATATRASVPLECSGAVSAEAGAEASLSLVPSFTLDWDADWFPPSVSVEKAEFKATVTGTAKAYAKIGAEGSCSIDKTELFRRTFSPITFSIGPVPVVLTPQLIAYWSAAASASAEISTSIEGSVSATGGVLYEDGDLEPIGEFTKSFTYTPPSLHAQGSIGARVIPAANLLLYGVVGPQAELSVGPQLDVDSDLPELWKLHVPIELNALIVVPVFDEEWGPLTVWSEDFLLADGNSTGAGPTNRATMTWDTLADIDLYTWETTGNQAWFGDLRGIPNAELDNDDTDGYGPEHFIDFDDPTDRKFTYGICYFDSHGAGATNVTVQLADPDGTPRTITRQLAAPGSSALIGASPAGGGYQPEPGWCESTSATRARSPTNAAAKRRSVARGG